MYMYPMNITIVDPLQYFIICQRTGYTILSVIERLIKGMTSVSQHTGSTPTKHRTCNGPDINLGDRSPFTTQLRRVLTLSLPLALHHKMSQTFSIGARLFLAGFCSVTCSDLWRNDWTNVLQYLHSTVLHIKRCHKKHWDNIQSKGNVSNRRVQKLFTGWMSITFSCKLHVWIFVDVILHIK